MFKYLKVKLVGDGIVEEIANLTGNRDVEPKIWGNSYNLVNVPVGPAGAATVGPIEPQSLINVKLPAPTTVALFLESVPFSAQTFFNVTWGSYGASISRRLIPGTHILLCDKFTVATRDIPAGTVGFDVRAIASLCEGALPSWTEWIPIT